MLSFFQESAFQEGLLAAVAAVALLTTLILNFTTLSQPSSKPGLPWQDSASPCVLNWMESEIKPRGEKGDSMWQQGGAQALSPRPSFVRTPCSSPAAVKLTWAPFG